MLERSTGLAIRSARKMLFASVDARTLGDRLVEIDQCRGALRQNRAVHSRAEEVLSWF